MGNLGGGWYVSRVPPADVLRELVKLAERLGIVVRFETFDPALVRLGVLPGRGGLCRLRGVSTVVVDKGLPVLDKVGILAEALADFDVEAIYLPPPIRHHLATRRAG